MRSLGLPAGRVHCPCPPSSQPRPGKKNGCKGMIWEGFPKTGGGENEYHFEGPHDEDSNVLGDIYIYI